MKKKTMIKKVSALVMSGALAASLLGGCGSAANGGNSENKAGSGELSTDADGLTTVTFVSPTALESFDYMSIYAADYLGYFEEEGLKVKFVEQLGSDDCKMLAAGTAQFAYPSPGVMMSSIDAGVDDIIAITNYDSVQIFGYALNKDSGITSVKDLKGKQIATYSEAWNSLGAPILASAGLSDSDVEYVSYGDSRYEAVASGTTPALITWLSEYYQLLGQGYDLDYIDGNEYAPQVSNSLCTSKTFAKEHPEIVEKFIRAFIKGEYFCYCNPEAAADITLLTCPNLEIDWDGACGAAKGNLKQYFGTTDEAAEAYIANGIGIFDMDYCQSAMENLLSSGTISSEIDVTKYYTNDYVESVTAELDKSKVEADAQAYECSSKQYKAQ